MFATRDVHLFQYSGSIMVVREEEFRFGWGDTRGMSNLSGASVSPHVGTGTHVLGSTFRCFVFL